MEREPFPGPKTDSPQTPIYESSKLDAEESVVANHKSSIAESEHIGYGGAVFPDPEHVLPSRGQRAGNGILVLLGRPELLRLYDEIVADDQKRRALEHEAFPRPKTDSFQAPIHELSVGDAEESVVANHKSSIAESEHIGYGGAVFPDPEHVLPSRGQRAGNGILVLLGRPELLRLYDEIVANDQK